jgi:DNA primase
LNKNELLARLDKKAFYEALGISLKPTSNGEAMGLCPFHDDHNPSLSVNIKSGLWNCLAGCDGGDIFKFYMRLKGVDFKTALSEMAEMNGNIIRRISPKRVATFEYKDIRGKTLYLKERFEPARNGRDKEFVFKHLKNGSWKYGRGCDSVLYRVPEIQKSETVFFVEGEAKADFLASWGLDATCLDAGAKSPWRDEYTKTLGRAKTVVILPDNDEPGMGYSTRIAKAICGKMKETKIVELPGLKNKEDIINWVQTNGNNKKKLINIIEKAPPVFTETKIKIPHNVIDDAKTIDYEACYGDVPTLDQAVYTGVFRSYIDLLRGSTEAPDEYHYYFLLTVLGLIIGKRRFVFYGRRQYPNFYFVLIGPSGKARKTTAMRFARDLLEAVNSDVEIITGVPSGESLIRELDGENKIRIIYQEEFAVILKKANQETSNTCQRLTELYDTPNEVTNPTQVNPAKARNFLLSLVAGSTREWLISDLNVRDIHGGFANRFGFVVGKLKEPIPLPVPYDQHQWDNLVKEIQELDTFLADKKSSKYLGLTEKSKKLWVEYYNYYYNKMWSSHEMALLAERLTEKIYKTAMVYATVERSPSIEAHHLELAIKVGNHLEACIQYLFSNIGRKEGIQEEQKVLTIIKREGSIGQSKLHQHFGSSISSERLKKILESLVYNQRIEITTGSQRGKRILRAI